MGLFEKPSTEEEIKMQLAELSVKLADVRKQVGELNARREDLGSRCADAKSQATEYEEYAKKAIAAGNPDDAKVFLAEKHKYDLRFDELSRQFKEVDGVRSKAMELHDQMVREINSAKTRLAVLQARDISADAAISQAKTVGSHDFEEKLSGLEADAELKAAMKDAADYVGGSDDNR